MLSRHSCIFSLATRAWNVPTMRVQHSSLSVLEPKCNTMQVDYSIYICDFTGKFLVQLCGALYAAGHLPTLPNSSHHACCALHMLTVTGCALTHIHYPPLHGCTLSCPISTSNHVSTHIHPHIMHTWSMPVCIVSTLIFLVSPSCWACILLSPCLHRHHLHQVATTSIQHIMCALSPTHPCLHMTYVLPR